MNWQVYRCPSSGCLIDSSDGESECGGARIFTVGGQWYALDYGCNHRILQVWPPGGEYTRIAEVKYPAETVVIADSDWTRCGADYGDWSNAWRICEGVHPSFFVPARHNAGANIVFGDGHAKWHHVEENDIYQGPVTFCRPITDLCWFPDGRPKY